MTATAAPAQPDPAPAVPEPRPEDELLDGVDPDALSPREALDLVYRLVAHRSGD
jgi:DNA mismatch repair protein MutS